MKRAWLQVSPSDALLTLLVQDDWFTPNKKSSDSVICVSLLERNPSINQASIKIEREKKVCSLLLREIAFIWSKVYCKRNITWKTEKRNMKHTHETNLISIWRNRCDRCVKCPNTNCQKRLEKIVAKYGWHMVYILGTGMHGKNHSLKWSSARGLVDT